MGASFSIPEICGIIGSDRQSRGESQPCCIIPGTFEMPCGQSGGVVDFGSVALVSACLLLYHRLRETRCRGRHLWCHPAGACHSFRLVADRASRELMIWSAVRAFTPVAYHTERKPSFAQESYKIDPHRSSLTRVRCGGHVPDREWHGAVE